MPQLQQPIKDFTHGENNYRISKLDARTGSIVLSRLMCQLQRMAADKAEQPDAADASEPNPASMISIIVMNLEEKDFIYIQGKALSVVELYKTIGETATPIPVLNNAGALLPELDVDDVFTLTQEALIANFARFFTRRGLEKVFGKPADSSPSSIQQ